MLYYLIPSRCRKTRNVFLLLVSFLLYVNWKPVYALILGGAILVSYFTALLLNHSKRRITILSFGIVISIFPLVFFKYFNFINDTIYGFLSIAGLRYQLPGLNWAIPIGISFFTFQALGYMWDVYYKKIDAERNFIVYALFLSFFPSIVAGPINKASLVIPQIKNLRPYFDYSKAVAGLKMLLWGMFMKVVVADRVVLYVDMVLPNYNNYTGMSCLMASILYTIQIYADFAGYSLMAIGVGKLLGFELTENFRRPYFAVSVTDFWRRWHISLSTWLKDYVYIPLGGSRCCKLRNYWNIFVTFLVSGIWHGANWTFIVWGILHGIFQIVEKALGQQKCTYGTVGKIIKIGITFILINIAWIFFRMPSLEDALGVIMHIFDLSQPFNIEIKSRHTFAFILLGISLLFMKDWIDEFAPLRFHLLHKKYVILRWFVYTVIIVLILLTGVFDAGQFIYANF